MIGAAPATNVRKLRFGWARSNSSLIATVLVAMWLIGEAIAFHAAIWPREVPWLGFADQQHYLESAGAWFHGDLAPARHNYPPGYPLMGAPFVRAMPWQPFAIPDTICLVLSLILFVRLAARLVPLTPAWSIAIPIIFGIATTRLKILREIWFTPWSTTGAVPLQLLGLLLALRFREAPGARRAAYWGLCLGALAGVRPVDAALLGLASCGFLICPPWPNLRQAGRYGAAALAGLLATGGPLAFLHLAAHRFSLGDYISGSGGVGFEWRLLPLRWVLLVIDSRPLTDESGGIAERIVWVAPGIAGLLFCCVRRSEQRRAWWLLAAAIVFHSCVYLCYRDLEPGGLWRYHNVHYFKWMLPFLLLTACQVVVALARPGARGIAVASMLAVAPLFMLRAEFVPTNAASIKRSDNGYSVPSGFPHIDLAAWLPLKGTWLAIYRGKSTMKDGARDYSNVADFKLFPLGGGAMLLPLRPLPATGLVLLPASDVVVDTSMNALFGSIEIAHRLPCGLDASCIAKKPALEIVPPLKK